MTQSEAREILEKAMRAFQRFRSISRETAGTLTNDQSVIAEALEFINPWVNGNKCPLPAMQKMLAGDKIEPQAFYNIMYILHKFAPEVKAVAEMEHISNGVQFEFPTPDIRWLAEGFEE